MKKICIRNIFIIGLLILLIGASVVSGINLKKEKQAIQPKERNQGFADFTIVTKKTTRLDGSFFDNSDDDWDYWSNSPHMFSNISGNVGIGILNPTNKLHIVGSASVPLVNIDQSGSHRGLRVNTTSACAIWVDNAGNHGIRITNTNGDGVHITNAGGDGIYVGQSGGWAGYFNGKGYFGDNVGIGTATPNSPLEVNGIIHSTNGGFKFPDGTVQTTAATGGGGGNTLDQAYDQGGSGAGRTIIADSGAVNIDGPDGLTLNGYVGINITAPSYELDVEGSVQANRYYTSDIIFLNNGNEIWRMFGTESGLYLKNMLTGNTYRFVILRADNSANTFNLDQATNLEQEIIKLHAENEALKERIEALEMILTK